MVLEADLVVAFLDIRPANPGHTLVVPRRHVDSFTDLTPTEVAQVAHCGQRVAAASEARRCAVRRYNRSRWRTVLQLGRMYLTLTSMSFLAVRQTGWAGVRRVVSNNGVSWMRSPAGSGTHWKRRMLANQLQRTVTRHRERAAGASGALDA